MGILGSFVSWGTQDSFIHVGGRLFFGITLYYFVFVSYFSPGKKRLALFMVYLLFFWKSVSIIHGLFTNRRSTLLPPRRLTCPPKCMGSMVVDSWPGEDSHLPYCKKYIYCWHLGFHLLDQKKVLPPKPEASIARTPLANQVTLLSGPETGPRL